MLLSLTVSLSGSLYKTMFIISYNQNCVVGDLDKLIFVINTSISFHISLKFLSKSDYKKLKNFYEREICANTSVFPTVEYVGDFPRFISLDVNE